MSQNKVPKSENILTASCEKNELFFQCQKKSSRCWNSCTSTQNCARSVSDWHRNWARVVKTKWPAFFDVQRRLKDSSRDVRLGALATLQQLEQAATLAELADDVVEMLFGLIDGALPRGALAGAAVAARRAERGAKRWEYTTPRAPPRAHFRRPLRPHQARARRGGPLGNCAARRRHRPAGSAGPSAQVERRGAR